MNLGTLRKLSLLMNNTSNDITRLFLNGISIRKLTDNNLVLTATDGVQLCEYIVNDSNLFEQMNEDIIVSNEIKKQLKDFIKKFKEYDDNISIGLEFNNNQMLISTNNTLGLPLVFREYPKTDIFKKHEGNNIIEFKIDFKILKQLVDGLEFNNPNGGYGKKIIKFTLQDKERARISPIHIESDSGKENKAIIMPCKL